MVFPYQPRALTVAVSKVTNPQTGQILVPVVPIQGQIRPVLNESEAISISVATISGHFLVRTFDSAAYHTYGFHCLV